MIETADPPTQPAPPQRLYDSLDDGGRAWLDEFNEGGYTEAVHVLLTDEAEASPATVE